LENVNDVKLFAMNPDCTQMVAVSGQHGKEIAGEGFNSVVQITETNTKNVFLGVGTDREETIQGGALIQIDARSELDVARIDEERPLFASLTPTVPLGKEPSSVGRYRSPAVLPDGRILVSWADGFVNALSELSLTPPDYGIYLYNVQDRRNELVQNYEDTWELYAKPIAARVTPPVLSSTQDTVDATKATEIGSIDVRLTSLGSVHGEMVAGAQFGSDGVSIDEALRQAKKVRIIEGFSSEGAPGTTMFGLTMAEGAAVLGEADVYSDGSWLAKIPPYLPVHLQPIDEFELAIRSQTTWIQGMPNESRVCGGCHESRTEANLPGGQAQTIAAGKGAQNFFDIVSRRIEYPWTYAKPDYVGNEVQGILTARCVSCHNKDMNGNVAQEYYTVTMTNEATGAVESFPVPRMDLSTTPVMVTYDRETREWPASYVSLFYPAALRMEMDAAQVTGEIPPEWAVPSAARESALLEKLNVTSLLDATRYAWPLGEAFSDASIKGGVRTDHAVVAGLTRDELTVLIRAIDMGGQFYARQNSDFVPYANDPVNPGGTQY
jgi:hypothetical protein